MNVQKQVDTDLIQLLLGGLKQKMKSDYICGTKLRKKQNMLLGNDVILAEKQKQYSNFESDFDAGGMADFSNE